MNLHTTPRALPRWRRALLAAGALGALSASACSPTDLLSVTDPDIINPSDVQSAAGANAVRIGALARFNGATSGGESMFLLGGLFADEWINGDSFIDRQEFDRRTVRIENSFLVTANRVLHRTRVSAEQAIDLLAEFNPTAPAWQVAEMHFVKGYVTNLMAEHFCNGLVLSTIVDGREQYGMPITADSAFRQALASVDAGLALTLGTTADDVRVLNALRVTRGRILMNLNRFADAGAAVAAVPTTFQYLVRHSEATGEQNQMWFLGNLARRYSVGDGEGGNGLNFASAGDPRVPVCAGGSVPCREVGATFATRDDLAAPYNVQMIWPTRETPVAIMRGVDARMIEAEAALRGGNALGALGILNVARTAVPGLAALSLEADVTAQENQLFRERAFWQFGRGYRAGDLRRLVRQYNRPAASVFPVGTWHKGTEVYGTDVNLPLPFAETNNPNRLPIEGVPSQDATCIDRSA